MEGKRDGPVHYHSNEMTGRYQVEVKVESNVMVCYLNWFRCCLFGARSSVGATDDRFRILGSVKDSNSK